MAKGAFIGVPTSPVTLGSLSEGETVRINENGLPVEFYVAKHDYESDLNGTGRTLLARKDVWPEKLQYNASNTSDQANYNGSLLDVWLNSTYKDLFNEKVKALMEETAFYYESYPTKKAVISRSVFILSQSEYSSKNGAPGTILSPVANKNGEWTTSTYVDDDGYWDYIHLAGVSYGAAGSGKYYARPVFTLPSDVSVFGDLITGETAQTIENKARKVKKMWIGAQKRINGLKQLDYIESTGTQWFDTGIILTQNHKAEMLISHFDTSIQRMVFGSRSSATENNFSIVSGPVGGVMSIVTDFDNYTNNRLAYTVGENESFNISISNKKLKINSLEQDVSTYNTFETPGTAYLFNGNGNYPAGYQNAIMRLYYCKIYQNDVLIRDYVPAVDANNVVCLYDKVNKEAIYNRGTGDFIAGNTISIAHKVKKAWIGVAGIARLFFGGGELSYYGTATALGAARNNMGATSIGNYALFAGGSGSSATTVYSTVYAYDKALTQSAPTALSTARSGSAATSVGEYAIFAGGQKNTSRFNVVNAYDKALTRSTPTALSDKLGGIGATTVGDYAIFAGGTNEDSGMSNAVNVYDTSLTKSKKTLSSSIGHMGATTTGDYALFAGGLKYNYSSYNPHTTVIAFDKSLTMSAPTELSVTKSKTGATTVGDYAIFAGGYTGDGDAFTAVVDVYNKSLTRFIAEELSVARMTFATTIGDYALFAGGAFGSGVEDAVDVYDSSLTHTISTPLSTPRGGLAATSIENYALFAGGSTTKVVDVYQVS